MNILHTVEFYSPSVGGAQEVVKQISERLVQRGHTVTVATTRLPERTALEINGVHIEEFDIKGNAVLGCQGETKRYQQFLLENRFDLMMNFAAQQWATDLVFPILGQIPYTKVLIPCGFSGLFVPQYAEYFANLPDVMSHYDGLIFHAEHYRDIDFARKNGLDHYRIIPAGASLEEFELKDPTFRKRYGIPEDVPMLLTVGSHNGQKGHRLALESFRRLKAERATLVIMGYVMKNKNWWFDFFRPLLGNIKKGQIQQASRLVIQTILGGIGPGCLPDCQARARLINLGGKGNKKVLIIFDPVRSDVVAAHQAADLFVFGSNIEYSPLVLFEAMAGRTPFITLACGNAAEIVSWSGGGIVAPTFQTDYGRVDGDPQALAQMIDDLLKDDALRASLAEKGYQSWRDKFTWNKISLMYEDYYHNLIIDKDASKTSSIKDRQNPNGISEQSYWSK